MYVYSNQGAAGTRGLYWEDRVEKILYLFEKVNSIYLAKFWKLGITIPSNWKFFAQKRPLALVCWNFAYYKTVAEQVKAFLGAVYCM